ncbi:MAG: PAS domain S-box protein [Gemmataceae bacterium]
MNPLEVLERQLARERAARKEAEAILEAKSLELYNANKGLQEAQHDLAHKVRERTRELEIANERLLEEVRERARAEDALRERTCLAELNAEIGLALGQEDTLGKGLQRCAEAMLRHLQVAFFRIWTMEEKEQMLVMRASAGLYTHLDGPHGRIPMGRYKIGQIAATRVPHLTNQVAHDPLISDQEWVRQQGMVAFAGHPLVVESHLVGVMALFARSELSQTVLDHLQSVADLIAQFIDRKKAGEELKRSQKRSEAVLNAALDCIISLDDTGCILQFNPAAERTFLYGSQEVLGKNVVELLFPALQQQPASSLVEHLFHRDADPAQQVLRELEAVRADGLSIPVEGWATSLVFDGRPLFTLCLRDITDRKKVEARVRSSQKLLDSIREVQSDFIKDGHPRKVLHRLLEEIIEVTSSEYGFIAEFMAGDESQPQHLKTHAITNIAWDDETRALYEGHAETGLEFTNFHTLFGAALTSRQAVIANDPVHDPRSGGLPRGHPPLLAFLGLPFFLQGQLMGMVGIANRKGGYTQQLVDDLQPVLSTCAALIEAHRVDQRRLAAEEQRDRFFTLPLDLLGVVGFDGHFQRLTGAWEATLGWSQAELYASRLQELIHPDDVKELETHWRQLQQQGNVPFIFENRIRRKAGGHCWLSWRAVSLLDRKQVYASAKDITDRKQAETALRDRETRIRSIVLSAVDGILVINDQGVVETYNPAAEKIFGYPAEEILGSNVSLLMFPEEGNRHDSFIRRYIETGQPHVINIGREVTGRHKSGSSIPLELTISEMRIEGEIKFTGIVRDISERKRAEREISAINARLEGVLAGATQVSIIATDLHGVITLFNAGAERLLGYTAAEVVRRCTPEMIHLSEEVESRAAELTAELGYPITGFASFIEMANLVGFEEREWTYVRKDGSQVPVSLVVTPLRDARKTIVGYLGIARDITERKRAEEQLQRAAEAAAEANRAKTDFLANMSHELRTPLNAVLGYTEMVQDPNLADTERATALHCIRRNGEHLLQLINDILDLSKIEAARLEILSAPCSPWQTVLEVISDLGVHAHAKGLELVPEPVGLFPKSIDTDRTRLRQILMNLVSNAVKFTDAGRVTVRLSMQEKPGTTWLVFEVEDEGVGMSPEQLEQLFQAFYQGDMTATRKYGGTGLGLRISKLLARALGGDIEVRSQRGRGSVFTLRLKLGPVAESNLQSGSSLSESGIRQLAERHLAHPPYFTGHILIAEDNPDNQRILTYILTRLGLQVEVAENGRIALERILAGSFDLVFMDIQMPELDGCSVTQHVRRHGCTLPIIALTAHAMQDDMDRCMRAGCSAYLSKPLDVKKLVDCLATFLPGKPAPAESPPTPVPGATPTQDPVFREMASDYLGKLPQTVEHLREFLQSHNLAGLAGLAHQIKGAAGMYGYPQVGELAGLIESASREGQEPDLLADLLDELQSTVQQLKVRDLSPFNDLSSVPPRV